MECIEIPCAAPECDANTAENHQLDENLFVEIIGIDPTRKMSEREEKGSKRRFWKWPALHFPWSNAGSYDLAQAEMMAHRRKVEKTLPVEPELIDGERVAKKKQRRWRWPVLRFPRWKAAEYDLAKAEKEFKTSEVPLSAAEKPEQDVHDNASEVRLSTAERQPEQDVQDNASEVPVSTAERQPEQDVQDNGLIDSRYEIGHKLGEGGYGSVYAATRHSDGLEVAVKVSEKTPDTSYMKVHGYKKKLPVEIGLTMMANKGPNVPQIIKLLDWEDKPDQYIMVLERPMPCMDLFNFVELRGGCLDEETARDIMRQAIQAANVCCKRGVFHRDIKLENLLLNLDTMEVKLIDFGCGDLMKRSAYKVMYGAGTMDSCPPEFNMKGKCNAKPATVWSLGILLFEMLCGTFPTTLDRHMISVNLWSNPKFSKECCRMICDCLQPKPKKRLKLKKMLLHDWFKEGTERRYSEASGVPLSAAEKTEQDVQDNASEVCLSTAERQPEQDVQDKAPEVPLSTADKQPEQDIQDTASEVHLSTAEKQPEQDVQDNGLIDSRYEIGHKLGEGGYGCVFAATRHSDGLEVAVKVSEKTPDTSYMKVHGYKKKLPVEIGLTMMANKGPNVPQIIQLLDWEDKPDQYIMVLERPMPCMDLFSFVELRGGCLDEETARDIMRQAIQAANVCCKRGVFHRDIKLENLLLNLDTMEVKLIDFGCGDLMKRSAYKVMYGAGTMDSCPPEFNMKGKCNAKPATVWSLGILLFEMLCGTFPTTLDRHMISVNLWSNPKLSKECCQMICDCLQPKPIKRLKLKKMLLHDWFKVMEQDMEDNNNSSSRAHVT